MSVKNLIAGQPTLLQHFDEVTTVYIKQYGAGNLRIGPAGDVLLQTANDPTPDGIVQVTATNAAAGNGWVPYFWKGDLWVISDAAGPVAWIAAAYSFYIRREVSSAPVITEGELEGDLSTYGRRYR